MTDQEIKEAIAVHTGYSFEERSGPQEKAWYKDGEFYDYECPDFCNDLNAMHEAEMTLQDHNQVHAFFMLIGRNVSATARQRAEAFLRAIGKWREE